MQKKWMLVFSPTTFARGCSRLHSWGSALITALVRAGKLIKVPTPIAFVGRFAVGFPRESGSTIGFLSERTMGRLHLITLTCLAACVFLANGADKPAHYLIAANETSAKSTEMTTVRKEQRLNLGGGLIGLFGGGQQSGGDSSSSSTGLSGIQQGLKGIQSIQKFIQRLQNIMGHPFSFRGLSDTMATMTGLLAAVGGGYLTYVSMVALFGSMMDPQNQAYQTAFSAPPHQYAPPPQHLNLAGGVPAHQGHQGYTRRQSSEGGSGLFFGSYDIGKMFQQITSINYPEASFKLLRVKDEACKQRMVCEVEKYLAKRGVASVILKGVSKKIPGMEKYLDAAYRGLANEDCSYAFSACPLTLGQTLLRSVGLN
ncbi:hypothetical protein JTE90_001280 [Oedothorax gibbosus]|uniref:Uncharacterized protein n=1 Tax=Oedothorax gibbosus TaxID=931172 RepID=A0AAV6V2M0_9ARAC|nr:hypothetical protein JTE90_001280 [Oedothorax gibbosus]